MRGSVGCEPSGSNLPQGCCQTPRREFQWNPKAQSTVAKRGLLDGETSSQTHVPTTSACPYSFGNCDRRRFRTASVESLRFAQWLTNSRCFSLLVFETDSDGRTFAGADASIFFVFVVFIAFFETAVRHPAVCCSLHRWGRQRAGRGRTLNN